MRLQVLFITYPSQAPWVRSEFGRSHLLLIIGLVERYLSTGTLTIVAMTSTRADDYLWTATWPTNRLMLIINTVMCLLAAALSYSSSKLRSADLPLCTITSSAGRRTSTVLSIDTSMYSAAY
jgi:hypothetical protein